MRLSIIFILLSVFIQGQSPRNINARDLITFPSIRNLQLHVQSQTIIYELQQADLKTNTYRHHLWRMATDGTNNRQFTYSSSDEWKPLISPSGYCIAFLSDRPDENKKAGTRIWVMPLSGGEAKPLTDPNRTILDFKWSTDGSIIYYLSPELESKKTKAWKKQRKESGFDAIDRTDEKPRIELWQVAKSSCQHRRLFIGDPGISSFDIDPSGETLVYSTNYTGDDNDWVELDLFLFSIRDSAAIRQLTTFEGPESSPVFSPDGTCIAFERPQDPKKPFSQNEIEVIHLSDNKIKHLTGDLDLTMSNFQWYNNQTLLLEVNQGLNNHLYSAALNGEIIPLSGGSAYIFRSALSQGYPEIAAVRQTATSLGEIIFSEGPGHPWKQLSHNSSILDDLTINPQTIFKWLSRDERFNLQGLVVLPHFSGNTPLPLIVDIHGGPAGRTDIALEQFSMYQAWASQGFAVFSPNYRGSEGYSATFQTANYRDLGGGDYHDIISGVKELIRRGIAHPDSLVIMGGSYGGYMTNWVITQTNMFKAAVSRYGIFDLKSDFSNSNYAQWELDYLGKPYWENASLYRRMSPSTFIKRAKTPTLILHGAIDENTFTSNSRELARALKTLKIPHRFFLYPREGHGMSEPGHRLDVFQRELSWVNQYLGRSQAIRGEDWLRGDIRVQILSADRKTHFLNQPGKSYLQISLLLDGSRLENNFSLSLQDFKLEPGNISAIGLPSEALLAPIQTMAIELGPDTPVIKVELVFPQCDDPNQILNIRNVGTYGLHFEL